MGFSHSWIAVQGLSPEQALTALGMKVSAIVEPADFGGDGITMAEMSGGWLLVLTDRKANAFEGVIGGLAALGTAVACEVNEHVMYSEARGYASGTEVWRVVHDSEQNSELVVTGSPPQQLASIADTARAEQAEADRQEEGVDHMFDVPALLARSICGYMLGEDEPEGFRYSRLKPVQDAKVERGFFARLFGRA